MTMTENIRKMIVRSNLPPSVARIAKLISLYPLYWLQMQRCRVGFRQYGHNYRQPVLFVAGLPKSGTTWMKNMMSSYPGFHELLIPEHWLYAMKSGDSHTFDLPPDIFSRFRDMLVLTRMHIPGSVHNADVLRKAQIRYVILYRDIRDVALSHIFYVRQVPWHPEYRFYANMSETRAIRVFADSMLMNYVNWVRSWHQNRDPELSLVVRYEDMLTDPFTVLTSVARHFELDDSPEKIQTTVEYHRFQRLSKGRVEGQESRTSFYRKGVAGDWKNYFTPELKELYKQRIGDFLIEFGYEQDLSW